MNRHFRVALVAAAAWAASGPAEAQSARVYTPRDFQYQTDDPNSARLGIFLGDDNGLRDTLGVLVNSVVEDGPAAKAGIKEGDRIQSIGGVNLKMTRDDASDDALSGMMARRLVRELDKLKAGDDVELKVYSGGTTRSVRVKTVASRELATAPKETKAEPFLRQFRTDRAALGLSTGGRATRRDTLGVFVMSVAPDGPAEKAGIVEGDRIAKINGVDLRVPGEDAGDRELSMARSRRFNEELAKIKAGDAVTLTVVSGGRQRDVKLNAVKASELNDNDGFSFFFNGDGGFTMPRMEFPNFRDMQVMPKLELKNLPRGGSVYYYNDGGKIRAEISEQVERALEEARKSVNRDEVRAKLDRALEEYRSAPKGTTYYRGGDNMSDDVREQVERAMEKARDAMEKARKEYVKPVVKRSVIRTNS